MSLVALDGATPASNGDYANSLYDNGLAWKRRLWHAAARSFPDCCPLPRRPARLASAHCNVLGYRCVILWATISSEGFVRFARYTVLLLLLSGVASATTIFQVSM